MGFPRVLWKTPTFLTQCSASQEKPILSGSATRRVFFAGLVCPNYRRFNTTVAYPIHHRDNLLYPAVSISNGSSRSVREPSRLVCVRNPTGRDYSRRDRLPRTCVHLSRYRFTFKQKSRLVYLIIATYRQTVRNPHQGALCLSHTDVRLCPRLLCSTRGP